MMFFHLTLHDFRSILQQNESRRKSQLSCRSYRAAHRIQIKRVPRYLEINPSRYHRNTYTSRVSPCPREPRLSYPAPRNRNLPSRSLTGRTTVRRAQVSRNTRNRSWSRLRGCVYTSRTYRRQSTWLSRCATVDSLPSLSFHWNSAAIHRRHTRVRWPASHNFLARNFPTSRSRTRNGRSSIAPSCPELSSSCLQRDRTCGGVWRDARFR